MEEDRYTRLARREAELAQAELERSKSAWLYALSQDNQGMRDHFLRVAARARFAWSSHDGAGLGTSRRGRRSCTQPAASLT